MGAAEGGQLRPVLGDAFLAGRPGGGRKIEPGETGGDVRGIVLTGRALSGAELLQALVNRVTGNRGDDGGWSGEFGGALITREVDQ